MLYPFPKLQSKSNMTTLLTLSLSTVKPTSPLLLFTQHPSLNPLQRKISVRRHLSQAPPFGSFSSWYYVSHSINLTIVLTIFAGLMSGLTVGYLSVDDLTMELRSFLFYLTAIGY